MVDSSHFSFTQRNLISIKQLICNEMSVLTGKISQELQITLNQTKNYINYNWVNKSSIFNK